jgi:RNA polymerase sigma-70 factor (ECF subfamily)
MAATDVTPDDLRPLLFSLAYRMVGTVGDAEDLVQEAFLRLSRSGEEVVSPKAFLTTVVTRLAIDHLRSARVRRETYVGEWLPEPLMRDPAAGPADRVQDDDSPFSRSWNGSRRSSVPSTCSTSCSTTPTTRSPTWSA